VRKSSNKLLGFRAVGRTAGANRATARGFTLIELLVVVAIMALLISILLPALATAKQRAKEVVCLTRLNQIYVGMQGYASDNADWLPSLVETWTTGRPKAWGTYNTCAYGQPIGLGLLYPRNGDTLEFTGPVYLKSLVTLYGCPVINGFNMNESDPGMETAFLRWGHSNWDYLWGRSDYGGGINPYNPSISERTKMTDLPDKTIVTCRHIWDWEFPVFGSQWPHPHGPEFGFNRLVLGGSAKRVKWDASMAPGGPNNWKSVYVDRLP